MPTETTAITRAISGAVAYVAMGAFALRTLMKGSSLDIAVPERKADEAL